MSLFKSGGDKSLSQIDVKSVPFSKWMGCLNKNQKKKLKIIISKFGKFIDRWYYPSQLSLLMIRIIFHYQRGVMWYYGTSQRFAGILSYAVFGSSFASNCFFVFMIFFFCDFLLKNSNFEYLTLAFLVERVLMLL